MIDFSELSLGQAEVYCDAYAAGVPERVAWLRRQVEGSGGPVLDRTPESLVPLWAWYLSWLKAGGRLTDGVEGVPPWQHPERPEPVRLPRHAVDRRRHRVLLRRGGARHGSRLYDPQREAFLTRADIPAIAGSLE